MMPWILTSFRWLLSVLIKTLGMLFPLPALPSQTSEKIVVPESVNFHFTRQCNYQCKFLQFSTIKKYYFCPPGGFCFHTAKTSFLLPLAEAKRGLAMLAKAGMNKINFSGRESFLIQGGKYLGEMEYGYYLDIMAVS